jgi:hypothetical protein
VSGTAGKPILACFAASVRVKLKHTYLTNQVCRKTLAEDLMESMLYKDKERGVPQHQEIRNKIAELLDVFGSADKGFSPAQLIDQLSPFRQLPGHEREAMKEQVHRQFADEFRLAERKTRLEQRARDFLEALDFFLTQVNAAATAAKLGMERVQEAARSMIRELESLPNGIWLWETPNREIISS